MKKLLFCVCCLLILSGCSEFNEKLNDSQSWEKEKRILFKWKKDMGS